MESGILEFHNPIYAEVKKIKAGHMMVKEVTAVHTCNASNKTFMKIHYLKLDIIAKVFLLQ